MKTLLFSLLMSLISSSAYAEFFCGKNHPGVLIIKMSELPKNQQATPTEWKQSLKDSGEKVIKTCKDNGNTVIVSQDFTKQKWAVIFDHIKKANYVIPANEDEVEPNGVSL